MRPVRTSSSAFLLLGATALAACATGTPPEPLEPAVRTVEVKVAQPVPCPALAALGEEPAYPDTDEAILAAPGPAARAALYAEGRKMRVKRLAEYVAAKLGCIF